ncbi:ferrous iron transport protein A [Fretibacterium sp. OH1220_COT-178]|uniref:ferrous iron transport protein A n=1 Tax=Fretibacterium sp. OH1220_COT-178 TaxID=2491047 RepID=UPI000F5EADA3|nr:ferrous iron transport protein A [Fretibacterium sp. OH1220_COT-178]RRD65293.1 ferrous iron transport protein A [Fretibacterium sp. OH1220_COT-178]
MFPLLSAPMNTKLTVLKSGSNPRMSKHLESLGLGEGSYLTLLQDRDGDVIVKLQEGESCLALDQEVAMSLLVREA